MPQNAFSSAKCQQRSRVAASRFGVEAAPLRFRGSDASRLAEDGFVSLKKVGSLPADGAAALALINARQPEGAEKLTADQVFVHFLEAANSNFVGDRALYLGDTTLQNIARDGERGVAFMNAHRTGGMSSPSELPFGQTFCGLYEEGFAADGRAAQRATVGVFLRKGVRPNGANGPTTDDLAASMSAGTINDVSVGLREGEEVCNVCGAGLYELNDEGDYVCPHVPGTHHHMSDAEIQFEQQRDPRNTLGVATYSLHGAWLGEVSAVYDGAVPGAGVKRVMQFAKGADMSDAHVLAVLRQAYEFYGPLLPFDIGGDSRPANFSTGKPTMNPEETDETPPDETDPVDGEPTEPVDEESDEDADAEELASAALDPTPENIARLQSQLAHANARCEIARAHTAQSQEVARIHARENFAAAMKLKVAPVARGHFNALFTHLQAGTATAAHLEAAISSLPQHPAFEKRAVVLTEVTPPAGDDEKKARRKADLLKATPLGRQVAAEKAQGK